MSPLTRTTSGLVLAMVVALGAGCAKSQPTLEDWNKALDGALRTTSTTLLSDGSSQSKACIKVVDGKPCVSVAVHRKPFDELRIIRPEGQHAKSAKEPKLLPYIAIRDGRLPGLTIDPDFPVSVEKSASGRALLEAYAAEGLGTSRWVRIAIVANGNLAYETTFNRPSNTSPFSPDKSESRALRRIKADTPIMARLYYSQGGDVTDETTLPLSDSDSKQFASEFSAMLQAYEALHLELKDKIDFDSLRGNESIYGESEQVGGLQWTE